MVQTPRDAIIFTIVVMIAGGVRGSASAGSSCTGSTNTSAGAHGCGGLQHAFGFGHVEQGWDAALATGLLGVIWGSIYVVRRSIVAPMVSHAGFNLLQLIKFVSLR
jgi:hypothetical protein